MPRGHDLLRLAGPGILGGASCGCWWRILREHGFAVDARYWPRACGITLLSLGNSLAARREERRFGAAARSSPVPPPLFVLGLWRSGTTHLHNLLTRDPRFAFADLYDALNPLTFLGGKRLGAPLLDRMVPRRRLMDGMRQGAWEPVEEDVAMAALGMSSMLGLVFPRSRDRDWRWVTLDGLDEGQRARWRAAYAGFVRRLAFAKGRRLVLKSPANTARIRHLLELFPEAAFVTIHRQPQEVLRSSLLALRATTPWWRLQVDEFTADWVVAAYGEVLDAYWRDRPLIPAGRLCEVAYADLLRDPLGQMARVYQTLDLPEFGVARAPLTSYLQGLRGYRRNHLGELPAGVERKLAARWERAFAEWGYPLPASGRESRSPRRSGGGPAGSAMLEASRRKEKR